MRRVFFLLLALRDAAHAAKPLLMNWSSEAYGPDGPWQAVRIEVGSNRQPVALYPGANWATTILADSLCSNTTLSSTCYAERAGTYNQNESTSAIASNQSAWETSYWNVQGGSIQATVGDQVNVGAVVPNVSFTTIYQTYQTYPNGKSYPVPVGTLALGAPYLQNVASNLTLNMIAAWLYTSGGDHAIPSYSYGMHIGSVDPPIPGSLVLGGYDQSRLLGDVSTQSVSLNSHSSGVWQIVLKDIGLDVATGGSPFNSTKKTGLFVQGTGAVLPKPVTIDPTKPYLYLPEATCDAITAAFPVSFDSGLGLYIWDTTRANYDSIVSSASYLSFSFNKDSMNDETLVVKVPLRLLSLTLQDPLVDRNLTYFPCFWSTDAPVLGRAFLQAAFVGVNWFEGNNSGEWFLGQAPGPSLPDQNITEIKVADKALAASDASWEKSWENHWSPLAGSANSTNPGSGLSTGAKAGIGVGVGVAGLILIAAVVGVVLLRRRRSKAAVAAAAATAAEPENEKKPAFKGFAELPSSKDKDGMPKELSSKDGMVKELASQDAVAKELGTTDNLRPQEILSSQEPPRHELE